MTTTLTTTDKALLAREIAIDQHGYRNYGMRAFSDGWDAAMAYVKEQVEVGAQEFWKGDVDDG
jgi:hypothetical protein